MRDVAVEVIGLELPLVKGGDDLAGMIAEAAERAGGLRGGDVVVVSSKAVSMAEGNVVRLSAVRPGRRAKRLAGITGQPSEFVQVVLDESDEVISAVRGAILTVKDGTICVNAGADLSNAPAGHAILWPRNPHLSARMIMRSIGGAGKRVGVVISDSVVRPLRLGTVGQAIGWAGLDPVMDCRGQPDIYGKPLRITFRALADQIATAAQLVMGEGDERRPVAIVRGLVLPSRGSRTSPIIPKKKCLYFSVPCRRGN